MYASQAEGVKRGYKDDSVAVSSLLTGLISYWKMEEASGTRFDAVTATANDLTDNNTVTSGAGVVSTAAYFTAANSESLTVADNANTVWGESGNGVTVNLWLYYTSNPTGFAPIFLRSSGVRNWEIITDTGSTDTWCQGGVSRAQSGALGTGAWHMVTAWFDPATKKNNIAIDDGAVVTAADALASSSLDATTGTVAIGSWAFGSLDGRVDEIGVWGLVLTAAQRTSLYNAGAGVTYPFTGIP